MPTAPPAVVPPPTEGTFSTPGGLTGSTANGSPTKPVEKEQTTTVEDLKAGADENRYDYQRVDSNNKPSNFVGFSEYAGLNDDMLRDIADRAAQESGAARTAAKPLLDKAKAEAAATPGTPVEKTPSYALYLDALSKASEPAQGAVGRTSNYQEDGLRQLYYGAQEARDKRDFKQNLLRAGADAKSADSAIADRRAAAERQKAEAAAARQQMVADQGAAKAAEAQAGRTERAREGIGTRVGRDEEQEIQRNIRQYERY